MHGYLGSYATLGLLLIAAALVFVGAFSANRLLRPSDPAAPSGKYDTYECGVETEGDSWVQFNFKYYLVALLFVVFDVEVVFLYTFAVAFPQYLLVGLIEVMTFIGILVIGYVYAWRKQALEWRWQ